MKALTATQARNNFFSLQNTVIEDSNEVRIKYKNWDVIMISANDYENILEHLYIMKNPILLKKIQNIKNLEFQNFNSLKQLQNDLEN